MANWIAISGQIAQGDDELRHIPTAPLASQSSPLNQLAPATFARSDIEIQSGVISFEVMIKEPYARCQIGLNNAAIAEAKTYGANPEIYLGLNFGDNAYGVGRLLNSQWDLVAGVSPGVRPDVGQWIPIRIEISGSSLDLFVKDVKVFSGLEQIQKSCLVFLFQSDQEIAIRKMRVNPRRPKCFVVMQFSAEFDNLYDAVIKPICEKFGYEAIRADDLFTTGLIIDDISRMIREATVVIADITVDNANVFYEVGYAHGIRKPTILLSETSRERLPFDVAGFRTIFYDNTIGGKAVVEDRLIQHLTGITQG